ncbi:hypothetical protein Q787_09000 [Ornithobacterium rhinotracheale H06-030791]|nr:hypothetical protein Q785_09185 [Ornithobacterium rhinotracheale ORT-UMN 88]KGB66269.1 hypothetical protein Q787_09000 [Ornithobacterium rhinotracheale H06-030791]
MKIKKFPLKNHKNSLTIQKTNFKTEKAYKFRFLPENHT